MGYVKRFKSSLLDFSSDCGCRLVLPDRHIGTRMLAYLGRYRVHTSAVNPDRCPAAVVSVSHNANLGRSTDGCPNNDRGICKVTEAAVASCIRECK